MAQPAATAVILVLGLASALWMEDRYPLSSPTYTVSDSVEIAAPPDVVWDSLVNMGPLGTPQSFTQASQGLRGGMTLRVYLIRFPQRTLRAWTYEMPDGKLEQYQIAAQN